VEVSVDLRNMDPRYGVAGGAVRRVTVPQGQRSQVDFVVEPRSFLRGSLLACGGGDPVPVRGVRVTLAAGSWSQTVETSLLGAFEIDEIPPGVYTLTVDAGSAGLPDEEAPRPLRLDLRDDVLGLVVRIGCGADPPRATTVGMPGE
jgi:hypothetical protein